MWERAQAAKNLEASNHREGTALQELSVRQWQWHWPIAKPIMIAIAAADAAAVVVICQAVL